MSVSRVLRSTWRLPQRVAHSSDSASASRAASRSRRARRIFCSRRSTESGGRSGPRGRRAASRRGRARAASAARSASRSSASGSPRRRAARRSARFRPWAARGSGRPGSRRRRPECSAEEDRARVLDPLRERVRILDGERQVLRRVAVRQLDALVEILHAISALRVGATSRDACCARASASCFAICSCTRGAAPWRASAGRLASSSCSAWESRSAATQAGVALRSATTNTSVGPASASIATSPKTRRLAVAT